MKFRCDTGFVHSGVRQYVEEKVYDLDAKTAETLMAMGKDKDNPIGALSFFAPIDEAATEFMKNKKCKATPEA